MSRKQQIREILALLLTLILSLIFLAAGYVGNALILTCGSITIYSLSAIRRRHIDETK